MMAQAQPQPHALFELTPLDCREEIDERTQKSYQNLMKMIAGRSVKECHEIYSRFIASSTPQHNTLEDLTMGHLVAILVEQDGQQSRYYRDVVTFSKDGLNLFSAQLNMIIIERLSKLRDHSIKQMFWITHQLLKASITLAEQICSNLIRQIPGGDLSAKNLWFIENTLELLSENRAWLINSTNFMVPTIIYTFMRLLADHMGPAQSVLRQKEIDFTIGLIRERFLDCLQVGRDFLRLLHNIMKLPEFDKLWQDIFNNPKSLHPSFQNPLQLLSNRTPRRLFQSRLTFDMERKINFLATQVKFGNQKRYQDWFHKQYLSSPESLSLRCDLIRYICTIIHPSNEVLCSDIIPRWAIIGWLLTTCTTSASANNSKLALFFDWLLYDAKMDNIMNIEPAILVMYYSMRSHPNVTASLSDFLYRIPTTFAPKLGEHIRGGIKKSLQQILEKRVIQSLSPLFENQKHDPGLKLLIEEITKNQIEPCPTLSDTSPTNNKDEVRVTKVIDPTNATVTTNKEEARPVKVIHSSKPINMLKEETRSVKVIYPFMTVQDIDFKEALNPFDETVRGLLEDLNQEKRSELRCNLMDKLISTVFDNNELSSNASLIRELGHCLAYLFVDDFSTRIFPSSSSQDIESLEESIASPFFILCRSIFTAAKPSTQKTMPLLVNISKYLEATGFLILYYLRVTAVVSKSGVANNYIDFCTTSKRKLSKCLHDDLFMALTYDSEMFCFMLPSIFGEIAASGQFPVTGNIELIHLVVSAIDPISLQELICLCLTGTAKVINREEALSLIESSLNWESWEQYCLWKLISAQSVPIENYISILPKLDSKANAEAVSSILLNLQKVSEPSSNMVQQLINCDCKPDDIFISSILRYWSMKTDVKDLAKTISSLFDSRPSSPQSKRKGQTKTNSHNSSTLSPRDEKILQHLDFIRQRAPKNKLLAQNDILESLSQMENLCNETQKKKFSELFANRPKVTKKQKKMDKE